MTFTFYLKLALKKVKTRVLSIYFLTSAKPLYINLKRSDFDTLRICLLRKYILYAENMRPMLEKNKF